MSTLNAIPFRSTIFYRNDGTVAPLGTVLTIGINNTMSTTNSLSIDTLTASTITVSKLNLASTTISLGQSTNQTYNNFSNGSYAPVSWVTAKSALSGTNKTVMSANGLYQMIVGNTTSGLFLSSDSGITWSTLTGGLPTLTGSAYWSDGAISANGQYITLSIYGGSLWMSADYGRTFALTNQPTPSIWLPLNGSVADSMGLSVVTTPGTVPGYVTLNYPGYTAQAVNLANTAGGTATRYIQGTWTGSPSGNFTISGWFNPQALTGVYQVIFSTYSSYCAILINPSNQLIAIVPSGGGLNFVNVGSSSTLVVNTWYYVSLSFQTNGTCSLYLNNTLLGSITNTQGVASITTSIFGLSGYDGNQTFAFNGYIDDLKITNSVSAYVPIPLLQPNIWMPFENNTAELGTQTAASSTIYLPFEGNVTDSMGASAPTATGPVTYVAANREGYTGQAIRLTNTAGGTATQYVRGNWSGATNFTVSFWFNAPSSGGNFQLVFSSNNSSLSVALNGDNSLTMYIPNASYISSSVLSINTWHFVTCIFQTNGTCSFYIDNSLIGTATNTGGFGTSSGFFELSGNDNSQLFAFNGTVDDLRIYNYAITYTPVSIVTVTGSLSYVPGIIGLNAVNLVNTAGGTATNYIRGAWVSPSIYTVSGWFNLQSYSSTGNQFIFSTGGATGQNAVLVYVSTTNQLVAQIPNTVTITTGMMVSLNTWYYFSLRMYPSGSVCSLYLNNLVYTATATATGASSGTFGIGTFDSGSTSAAFNGYIDDFRIYNADVGYHVLAPQNYRSLALSGTGQYALASAASGWVVGSSDLLKTWSKQAVCVGTQGDIIQPNFSGLSAAATSWTQNGVNWVATESSNNGASQSVSRAFNNTTGSDAWLSNNTTQRYTAGSPNGNAASTNIQTIGATAGEWIQIESSVPMVLASFAFGIGLNVYPYTLTPKTYYIIGSTDGTTWVPLQFGNFTISAFTSASANITMNITGTQTLTGNMVGSVATTAYSSYTTNAYRYFRLIGTSLMIYGNPGDATYMEVGEWYLNFVRPLTVSRPSASMLSLNHTGQYQLVATGPASGSVMPNQTGLATNTWTQSGVNWAASASTTFTGYSIYALYNNTPAGAWLSAGSVYNTSTGVYSGSISTTIQSIGSPVFGEWVQIQASVPLVLQSYTYADGGAVANIPKTYYIVGSNDGSTWVPLQFVTMTTNPFTTSTYTTASTYITLNTTGAITIQGNVTGQGTSTAYTFSTQPYMYFRMVITSLWTSNAGYCEFTEWLINFQNSVSYSSNYGATWLNTSPTVSNESVALSPSGQYALSTNSVSPFARLTLDNTNLDSQGVLVPTTGAGTVTYSTSIKTVGTHSAFFNNTPGAGATVSLNYTLPTVLTKPSALTMSCWVYPTSLAADSCAWMFANSGLTEVGPNIFIVSTGQIYANIWSVNGNAQVNSGTNIILVNTWTHLVITFTGSSSILFINGVQVGSNNSVAGPLSLSGGGAFSNLVVGTGPNNLAYKGYIDDVRLYTSALNADEINGLFRNPALTQTIAVSNSYLPITSYTEPVLPGITANVVDTAVSQTGQYMVAVTSSTTNNVYYSTDYGATFTALTIGTTAMVSCSISYDGSYLTVTNTTTTYTLNKNTRGFTLAIGNQAGLINQGLNAIAIGDKAGQTNQSANSIILNATGVALNAAAPGFYVAPIATAASSSAAPFNLLGYGTDNQVVQSSALTVLQNGNIVANANVGIGTALPTAKLSVIPVDGLQNYDLLSFVNTNGYGIYVNTSSISSRGNTLDWYARDFNFASITSRPILTMRPEGNVGIGKSVPTSSLDVTGGLYVNNGVVATFANQYQGLQISYTGTGATGYANITSINPGSTYNAICLNPNGGNVGIGTTNPVGLLSVALDGNGTNNPGLWNGSYALFGPGAGAINGSAVGISWNTTGNYGALICLTAGVLWRDMYYSANQHIFSSPGTTERMRITNGGLVGIGTASPIAGYALTVSSTVATTGAGQLICYNSANTVLAVYTGGTPSNAGWNTDNSVLFVARDTATGRSINATGTVNTGGSDYAEYMVKNGDFIISKGDIVGVDKTGLLTNRYDDAVTFVVKTTNPSFVGGDSWGTEETIGVKPTALEESASEEEKAVYQAAMVIWEAALDVERKRVDRIAFSGRVPVNVRGAQPGDHIIPTRNDDGSISGRAVAKSSLTFDLYEMSVGKVIDILVDGRASIIVKAC